MPIKCPTCCMPLINEYRLNSLGGEILHKICKVRVDHYIHFASDSKNHDEAISLEITIKHPLNATWYFHSRKMVIHTNPVIHNNKFTRLSIPFFEPNLKDYSGLVNKLKTYVLFS